jgi:hypothetical protein
VVACGARHAVHARLVDNDESLSAGCDPDGHCCHIAGLRASGATGVRVCPDRRPSFRQVLGAVAQFEKAVIVSKLKAARVRKRRATGRCEGRKPYGTRPGEADVVALAAH